MPTETATASPVLEVVARGAALLARRGIGGSPALARLEAELLAAHVLGIPRWRLWIEPDDPMTPAASAAIGALCLRRAAGEPLQYLTGRQEFWGLSVQVRPGVLIPRPETEGLVEAALRFLPACGVWPARGGSPIAPNAPALIVEIGTGSGCLTVALARAYPKARVVATDISSASLAVAAENARRHGVIERVTFVLGDLFEPLGAVNANLIVSNPPYVTTADWGRLPSEIRLHEPRAALDGGPDGLEVVRRLLAGAGRYLRPDGLLLVEIGAGQAAAVRRLARANRFTVEAVERDLAGIPRVLVARTAEWTA